MDIAKKIIDCFNKGNKLMIIGNGGSAEMASHMAAEFINRFEHDRKPLPAIALTDIANITSIANDSNYKWIFQRPLAALGKPGDILIIFTTTDHLSITPHSQNWYTHSENITHAVNQAHLQAIEVIFAPRIGGGTAEKQENQLKWLHEVCREVELHYI